MGISQKVKAIITAGGRGTRLRPITHTSNKHLIPIANKPMIHYAIEAVREAGISDIGIVINPDTGDVIREVLGEGEPWGVQLTYIVQDAPRGLAHVVKVSEEFIGKDPFVFYLGDNIVVGGIHRFLEAFRKNGDQCHLVRARVPEPQRFRVPEIRDGRVVRVEEKPTRPRSNYAVTGIYFYDADIFKAVNAITPSVRGELEISDAHQYLIDRGCHVGYSEITGWWKDTGKPEDLLDANRLVLDQLIDNGEGAVRGEISPSSRIVGRVVIHEGAKVVGSLVHGPAIIGRGTLVENSYVGPFTAIGSYCVIRNSELEFSIMMEGARILDAEVRVEQSIIGKEAVIFRGQVRPKTQKFIVGDHRPWSWPDDRWRGGQAPEAHPGRPGLPDGDAAGGRPPL